MDINHSCENPTKPVVKTGYWKIALILLAATVSFLVCLVVEIFVAAFLPDVINPEIARLSKLFIILLLMAIIASRRSWRVCFPITSQWTWTLLLGLPFLLLNALNRDPYHLATGMPLLMLVLINLGIGLEEELFFRGFAFLGGGLNHPRYTVLLTSLVFSQLHWTAFEGGDMKTFVWIHLIGAFIIGLIFGIIRVATGSLFWPVLLHMFVDLTNSLSPGTGAIPKFLGNRHTLTLTIQVFFITILIITLIVLFRHPAMKPKKPVEQANIIPPPAPVA
jgi:membrane protease YdiL (CAAX protease family)